jgi:RimJ/RimL family protein N-acetyltransferase
MKEGTNLQLVIKHKDTKEYLGNVGLHHLDQKNPELGIWIKKEAHGCAYGLEAITGVIEWAKQNLDFNYLKYPVDRHNIPSRKIPERNNGVIRREYLEKNTVGKELDIVEYWIYK